MLKSKIHKATVTEANLNYVGSITIDEDLMKAAGMHEYEKVQVVNNHNGERIETYIFKGKPGSGIICLNGAAARKFEEGDHVIIMTYCEITEEELSNHKPIAVFVDENNKVTKAGAYGEYGSIT